MLGDWLELEFFSSDKFKQVLRFLSEEKKRGKHILPDKGDIFKALVLTSFEETKVVILGQDPYPTPGHAMGLAFSVPSNTKPLPPSLKNIFTEIRNDFNISHEQNPDLTRWAKQGVLLLNTSLTVIAGSPNSHQNIGWSSLVNDVIRAINHYKNNVVFILWGNNARKKSIYIDPAKHLILQSAHPSPLSAHNGFFGSHCFSKTNEYLLEHRISHVNW